MADATEVGRLLDERPDLEPAVATVLETDERHDGWTFDDVDVDSGSFGELVSRGIVEKHNGEYHVTDPAAVRAALDGDTTGASAGGTGISASTGSLDVDLDLSLPTVDTRAAAALAGALALVVAFRLSTWSYVFRDGDVVLSGNDPYFYRYWVDTVAQAGGTLDFGGLASLPGAVTNGEPLMVATLWFFTDLLGGGQAASGAVTAWYPVVSAVLVGLFTYLFTRELTDDRRAAVAAVVFLAVVPVHAFRSGLGFADHHAFDYVWLTLTAACAVALARRPATRDAFDGRALLAVAGLAVGVTGQVLAWESGPLLLLPLLLYLPLATLLAVQYDDSPLWANAPMLAGLGVAAVLAGLGHLAVGWHTDVVGFSPAMLFGGGLGVTFAAEAIHRADLSGSVSLGDRTVRTESLALAGVQLAGVVGFVLLITVLVPEFGATLEERLGVLLDARPIVEYQPLFSFQHNYWLSRVGPMLFVGIIGFAWATLAAARGSRRWLTAATYGWSFTFLAGLQQRFSGELAPFVAAFTGIALVYLAWKVDVARPPAFLSDEALSGPSIDVESGGQVGAVVVLFVLLGVVSAMQAPILGTQAAIQDGEYATADYVSEYADPSAEYPENYVLTRWSRNRFYNYFVTGNSDSYVFAEENYFDFLNSRASQRGQWYERFEGRVGYVVIDPGIGTKFPGTGATLDQAYGSRHDDVPGSGHYRAIYERDGYTVFEVVPGARITGTTEPNSTASVLTTATVDGKRIEYERQVQSDAQGRYSVLVAYPGSYRTPGGPVNVTERAVDEGRTVQAGAD